MPQLSPCPECRRHVRSAEQRCPFCSTAMPRTGAPRLASVVGVKRAALFALSATVAATACGAEDDAASNAQQGASSGSSSAMNSQAAPSAEATSPSGAGGAGAAPSASSTSADVPGRDDTSDDADQDDSRDDAADDNSADDDDSAGDDRADDARDDGSPDDGSSDDGDPKPQPSMTANPRPTSAPTIVALYGAIPAPIDEPPSNGAGGAGGSVNFDPEGAAGSADAGVINGGAGGTRDDFPQAQPVYGAVPAPQE